MDLEWEKGLLQTGCYRTTSKSGETTMEDRKDSENRLAEPQSRVVTVADTKEWRQAREKAERVVDKEELRWVCTKARGDLKKKMNILKSRVSNMV